MARSAATLRWTGRLVGKLLERKVELRGVEMALAELCGPPQESLGAREGGLLLFAGSAGVGKTAVLGEARRRAAAHGCMVLWARGCQQRACTPFHVVRELFQPFFAAVGEAEARTMLGCWFDILGSALGLTLPEAGPPPDPQGVQDGLDWVVTHLSARRAPVVLVVDDAHWADGESLDWLAGFVARVDELPMLVILAYRPDERPAVSSRLRELAARHGSRPYDLAPLTEEAAGLLLSEWLGVEVDEAFRRECWALTAGNPFETIELAAAFRERSLTPDAEQICHLRSLAARIKGTGFVESIRRLGPAAVRFTWAAAVLGTGTSPQLVADVAALAPLEARDAAEQLCRARVLTTATDGLAQGSAEDSLEFRHPLIATAVYQAIPAAMRVALHGRAAQLALDAGHGATAAARHLLETHPDGDPATVQCLRDAAREALLSGAPDAARRFLARALREPPPPEIQAAILFEFGRCDLPTDPAAAVRRLTAALAAPQCDPALREAVVYRLAQALAHNDRLPDAVDLVAAEARRTNSPATRLRMRAEHLLWDRFRVDAEDVHGRSRRLARLAERLDGRHRAEQHILGLRAADAVMRAEPVDVALTYADKALAPGIAWADEDWGFEVPVIVALVYMMCDQPARAEELFTQAITEFERHGWRGSPLSLAHTLLGYVYYRTGRLDQAEDCVRAGQNLADRVSGQVPAQRYAAGCLLQVLLARGRIDEAQAVAAQLTKAQPRSATGVLPDMQAALGQLLLASGQTTQAETLLSQIGRTLEDLGMHNPAWCRWQLDLALARAAHPDRARTTAQTALARARAFGTPSAIGRALHVTAQLSDDDQAQPLLAAAIDHLERSPARYELACALIDHGGLLLRAGRLPEAAQQMTSGIETATGCGADHLAEHARTTLTNGLTHAGHYPHVTTAPVSPPASRPSPGSRRGRSQE